MKSILKTKAIATALLFLLFSCIENQQKKLESEMTFTNDEHSFAAPNEAVMTHLDWQAEVNFNQKKIFAIASIQISTSPTATQLVLDTKELAIKSVQNGKNQTLDFEIGEKKPFMGAPLQIAITPETKTVIIEYETSPNAEAVQWLDPAQTAGKEQPFLFTQSQAILARSWIPLQDSPGIRFTYNAKVKVPKELIALMSASNPTEKNETGVYQFEMKQPIPAYLMALAVGDVVFASLGERSGVYTEPAVIEKAAYEFEDLESMIAAAENLYGSYQWQRYDLIVLPPSFPFGGMENPRLTFATPTILAGDKSLTSLVAHELAHSWSGNLVTNATWEDFWLNEGFTVYFETRIMEAVYGREYAEMLTSLSFQNLKTEIDEMVTGGNGKDTHLKLDLKDRNPDDGMTGIAYDKGYLFLRMLEETVGRDKFDEFLKEYFTQNAFKVMTTEGFVEILKTRLFESSGLEIDSTLYKEWIYGPGLPSNCPQPVSDKFENVANALSAWYENTGDLANVFGSDSWSTHEWLHFIRNLKESMSAQQMKKLDDEFGFTNSGNSEIFAAWSIHIIANNYESGYPNLKRFLVNTGRRKFLMPLYRELAKTPKGLEMAKTIYEKARPNYHFVSYSSIDVLLENVN